MYEDYYAYDENGNLKSKSDYLTQPLPPPIRLMWDFNSTELTKTISDAYSDALKLIDVSKTQFCFSKHSTTTSRDN